LTRRREKATAEPVTSGSKYVKVIPHIWPFN
jgi:hypothetical protein